MKKLILFSRLFLYCILAQSQPQHYVFFNIERDRIQEKSFLETESFVEAQLKYTWRELEPEIGKYDFGADYIFWCTQPPFYNQHLISLLNKE